jgi:hypothetical protein
MSGFQRFPRHLHRANGAFRVVNDDAELKAGLADGWYPTPLEAEKAAGNPIERNPAEGEAPEVGGDADTQPPDGPSVLKAADAIALIEASDDAAQLEAWKAAEDAGKARKGVLAAIDARLEALAGA